MALFSIKNVRLVGISAGVPKKIIHNLELKDISKNYDAKAFVETTGVLERHVSNDLTTSDLCIPAAEKLLSDIGWNKKDIGAIIFVSQTNDYIEPATACICQYKLGLSKECLAEDIGLGCSGWVYGLANTSALLQNGDIKKALLLVGDARYRVKTDRIDPLFGFAGTATALEYKAGAKGFSFHLGTDGSDYDAIIIPDGGSRNPVSLSSFRDYEFNGKVYNRLEGIMKGMDVFSFGITVVPESIKKLARYVEERKEGQPWLDYDYYILHQANMKINKFIVKKLKLPESKVPYSMPFFGNTSSASIPLTIVTQLKGKIENKPSKLMCCGFGIGLSFGTVSIETDELAISDLIQI